MAHSQGHCDPRFESVRQLFDQHLASGNERGASLCVNIDGTTVIDLWGGHADVAQTKPWTENTIVPVWSSSKCITNLAALLLVDRGLLDPYARVSQYWPEFAANGKENIEVRQFLSHMSGVPAWETPVTPEDIYNVPLATQRLAAQAPWWTPGTASGYHMISQGHLVGELVCRISGKSLNQFIRDELAGPLNADFQLGAVEKDWPRVAEIIPPGVPPIPNTPLDRNSLILRTVRGSPVKAEESMTPAFRQTELGASNGFSNARATNRILSMITLGGVVDGQRFLSPETIDLIFREQSNGPDLVLGNHTRFGIGYALPAPNEAGWIPDGKVCFWGGWGGSMMIMDLDHKMTLTYAMNRMTNGTMGNDRSQAYGREIYAVLRRLSSSCL